MINDWYHHTLAFPYHTSLINGSTSRSCSDSHALVQVKGKPHGTKGPGTGGTQYGLIGFLFGKAAPDVTVCGLTGIGGNWYRRCGGSNFRIIVRGHRGRSACLLRRRVRDGCFARIHAVALQGFTQSLGCVVYSVQLHAEPEKGFFRRIIGRRIIRHFFVCVGQSSSSRKGQPK